MQQPATTTRRGAQTADHAARASQDPTAALPLWESFPAGDRQQVVRVLIQTARRQVQRQPLSVARRGASHDRN
jgi:hypothetical protein